MIGCTTGLLAASLREADARAIYGPRHGPLTVGVTAPSGVAKSVDGGFLVDGRWGWGSGAVHADWVCGGCVVHDENNEKRLSSSGSPEVWLMIFSKNSFLGSLSWAFFWKISNFEHEYFGRMFYLALYCFGLFNFLSLIKLDRNLKTISFLLLVMITYDYWHFRGTQEILIFSFLLILSKYLFNLILENKSSKFNLIIILLFLNLIIWTKNEGILLSLIISFIILIFFKENLRFKLIFLSVPIFLIFLRFAIFKFYGLDLDLSQDFDFSNIITIFMNNFKTANIYIILKYVVYSTVKFPHIILSLFFALMIIFDRKLFKKIIFLYVYLFLSIFLIFFIYLSSPQKLEFMVSTGSLRLLFEFSAPYLLFILFFFRERIKI